MEPLPWRPNSARNISMQMLLCGVLFVLLRLSYSIFSFFPHKENLLLSTTNDLRIHGSSSTPNSLAHLSTSKEWCKNVHFYSAVFQDHITQGFLRPNSKVLCIETKKGEDVFALKEMGVVNATGISNKAFPPLVRFGLVTHQPFRNGTFDFVFSGFGMLDAHLLPYEFAHEISRTLKRNGYVVVHSKSVKDSYSLNSFLALFKCCQVVLLRKIDRLDSSLPSVHEIVLKKENFNGIQVNKKSKCDFPWYKHELIDNAEPLITKEPSKPWTMWKKNRKNMKYLPSMVDISFKQKYVYVDVGSRSYDSSIGSWFIKQYPKQKKAFEVFAIEADKAFHAEYETKKGVSLLPYAAWIRNETLFFEINRELNQKIGQKRRGMGRIQYVHSSTSFVGDVDKIRGFDFANWLKKTVSERDFVVMKMDVEGTEFELIPRLFETGAICLIDEMFLECHYNRWQKCCPGKRTSKYQKTYEQCLELFSSLRGSGVLVHQWW